MSLVKSGKASAYGVRPRSNEGKFQPLAAIKCSYICVPAGQLNLEHRSEGPCASYSCQLLRGFDVSVYGYALHVNDFNADGHSGLLVKCLLSSSGNGRVVAGSRENLKEEKGMMPETFCQHESMRVLLWSAERQDHDLTLSTCTW